MTPRKLKRLYTRYTKINSYYKLEQLQAKFDAELLAEGKRLKPKNKKWDSNKISKHVSVEFRQKTFEKYSLIATDYNERIERVKEQIYNDICSISLTDYRIEEQKCDEWVVIDTCSTCAFSSQGFGAKRYAQNSLKPLEDKLINQFIDTQITYERFGTVTTLESGIYRLEAKLPLEYGWLIGIHPDSQISFVELIQKMWKTGVNPRVHFPLLPHGFEENHNISYT